MADGYEQMSTVSSIPDGLIQIATRLGGVETALRGSVTHEKLIVILNDNRRELVSVVRDSETHVKDTLEAQSNLNDRRQADMQASQDRRITDLFTSLDRMIVDKVTKAVTDALSARDEAEAKARASLENKTKDTVRPLRLAMWVLGPIGCVAVGALGVIGWMAARGVH